MDGVFTHVFRETEFLDNINNEWWSDTLSDDELELPSQHHSQSQQAPMNENQMTMQTRLHSIPPSTSTQPSTTFSAPVINAMHSRTRSLASFDPIPNNDSAMTSSPIATSIASFNALQTSIKDDENSLLAMALLLSSDAQDDEWKDLGLSDLASS